MIMCVFGVCERELICVCVFVRMSVYVWGMCM